LDASSLASRAALLAEEGEVPVGALPMLNEEVIGEVESSDREQATRPLTRKIVAMRAGAAALGNYRLSNATLYVTLDRAAMCMGAVLNARVARVVFGAWDAKAALAAA